MSKFFDLERTDADAVFRLCVTPDLCVGPPGQSFMFGGVGLAASVSALEAFCQRPLIWSAAQYVSYARPDQTLDVRIEEIAKGRHTTQAAVAVMAGEREVLRAMASLGARPMELMRQWAVMPNVPPPDECPQSSHWRGSQEGLHSRLEVRVAKGRYGLDRKGAAEPDGRLVIWARPRGGVKIDASVLAVLGDLVPSGIGNALGMNAGGNSLDNTLRIVRAVETDWVLLDIAMHAIESGFAHGDAKLFARSGELLALGSQSLIVRVRDE